MSIAYVTDSLGGLLLPKFTMGLSPDLSFMHSIHVHFKTKARDDATATLDIKVHILANE